MKTKFFIMLDVFGGNEEKIMAMLDAIKDWSQQYTKKSSPDAVLIDKNSGWRGSAMMDHRSYSDDDY
jgi:hypothetical protein